MTPGSDGDKVFIVDRGEITGRFDAFYWQPKFHALDTVFSKHGGQVCKLGHVTYGLTNGDHGGVEYTEKGTRYLRGQSVTELGLDLDKDTKFIADSEHKRMIRAEVVSGDVLYTIAGSIGNACVVGGVEKANINQAIVRIKPGPQVLGQYLCDFLNSAIGKLQSRRIANGGVQLNINFSEVKALKILLPDLEVQRQFVEQLAEARSAYKTALKQADELLAGIDDYLLSKLGITLPPEPENTIANRIFLTSKKSISGGRIDPYRYVGYQQLLRSAVFSSGVDAKVLRRCITDYTGGDWGLDEPSPEDGPLYTKCLVIRNTEFDNDFNLSIESGREAYRYLQTQKLDRMNLQPLDILVEKSGGSPDQPVGRVAFIPADLLAMRSVGFSNFLTKLRPNADLIDPLYLFSWLKTAHRLKITESMQAQTNGIRNLIMKEYLDQLIPLPKRSTQELIAKGVLARMNEAQAIRNRAGIDLNAAKRRIETMLLGEVSA